MPSKSPLPALRGILHHIDLAKNFVTGFDFDAFLADERLTIRVVTARVTDLCESGCCHFGIVINATINGMTLRIDKAGRIVVPKSLRGKARG